MKPCSLPLKSSSNVFSSLLVAFFWMICFNSCQYSNYPGYSNNTSGFALAYSTSIQAELNTTILDSNNSSSTNDSLICHPILLRQGFKSELGLCDDYFSSYIVMGTILSCHSILLLITLVGLFHKLRKLKQAEQFNHLKVNFISARNPVLMICGAVVGWLYTLIMSSRVLIGRKIFPCIIFSLIYYLSVPGLASTIIIRCTRLIALTKLHELKVKIGKREMLQEKEETKINTILITNNEKKVENGEKEGNDNIQIIITMANSIENLSTITSLHPPCTYKDQQNSEPSNFTITNTEAITNNQDETESPSVREHYSSFQSEANATNRLTNVSEDFPNCVSTTNAQQVFGGMSISPSSGTYSSTNGFMMNRVVDEESNPYQQSVVVDITKLHELDLNTPQNEPKQTEEFYGDEFKKMNDNFENGKLLKFLRFLTGSKFIVIFYILILGTHTLIYLTVGVVDYFNYFSPIPKNSTSNKKNAFVVDTYMFSPGGCGTGSYNTNFFLGMLSLYASTAVVLAIVALVVMKKDVWQVKRELVLVAINWILCIAVFGIPNMFSAITVLVDYYFPWTSTILLSCLFDMVISCTIPVFALQQIQEADSNKSNPEILEDIDLHKCLKNQKWNALFLQYSEQCFACEDIMFWNAVEQFKSVTAERLKRELFYNIYKTYIRVGSPLELNIARMEFNIPEIESQFNALCAKRKQQPTTLVEGLSKSALGKSNNNQAMSKSKYLDLSMSENICVRSDIFDRIQTCCEHNMRDNFNRFHLLYDREMSSEVGVKRIRDPIDDGILNRLLNNILKKRIK